eukprot:7029319-Karenia_brevis.AAC.2
MSWRCDGWCWEEPQQSLRRLKTHDLSSAAGTLTSGKGKINAWRLEISSPFMKLIIQSLLEVRKDTGASRGED